jgi:hypothetical protein
MNMIPRLLHFLRSVAVGSVGLSFLILPLHGDLGRYQSIVARNPFGLKDKIKEKVNSDLILSPPTPEPIPALILTGITKIRGVPKAYLVDPSARTDARKFITISLGARVGELSLVNIDFVHRCILLKHQNRNFSLSMAENDMATFRSKSRIGGEPQSIAYENIRQSRVTRSTILAISPAARLSPSESFFRQTQSAH